MNNFLDVSSSVVVASHGTRHRPRPNSWATAVVNPYYDDGRATIYLGDSRELIRPVQMFHLASTLVTDPPYGLPGEDVGGALFALALGTFPVAAVFSDWRESRRYGSALPDKIGELAWEYGWISGGRARAKHGILPTHNTIHIFGDPKSVHFLTGTVIKRTPGFSSPRQTSFAKKSGHPFEKPVALMRWLIERMDGEVVLDPFMGSGTTLVAGRALGRRVIGIEVVERWCEVAARRLSQERLGLVS